MLAGESWKLDPQVIWHLLRCFVLLHMALGVTGSCLLRSVLESDLSEAP